MKANPSLNRLSFSPRNCTLNDKEATQKSSMYPFQKYCTNFITSTTSELDSFQMKAFMRALCETAVFNWSWCPITGHAIREYSHFHASIVFRGILRKIHFTLSLELQILILS
ncbi:hypothetical protein CEXT_740231 [Caerostris extrusa]|uniref:Uncharacterized protein n=1 Tax=Caerostris extrusa TaxID=172846 RepID=A0AAV4RJW8_CAEEX|nr:hypothetical protein CEXT_740231 [Caerostris extrusa]